MTKLRKLFLAALTLTLPVLAAAQAPATPEATPPATPAPATPATPPAEKTTPPPPPAVQVYGTINVNLQYTDMSDATAPAVSARGRFGVSADSSNVGVRGTLKLSDMYSVVYQCETGANVEGEAPASLCNRNSRIGLSGFWGTLAYGNWDTPMKSFHYGTKADDPFGNTDVFGFQGILGSPGYQTKTSTFDVAAPAPNGGSQASFDLRTGNSVLYFSPKIAGLSGRLQWGTDEFRAADGIVQPMLLGAGVAYELPFLAVVATAEYHEDAYGIRAINPGTTATPRQASTNASKDLGVRLAAGVDVPLPMGALNVVGWAEDLMYKQDNAGGANDFKEYSRIAWLLGAKFRVGPHEFRARYSQAMKPDIKAANGATLAANAEDNLGAQQYTVGYAYYLAKSTQVYLSGTQIMNESRARYTFGVAGPAVLTTTVANTVSTGTPAGADLLAVGLGFRHAF